MDARYNLDETEGAYGTSYLNAIVLRCSKLEAEVLQHGGSLDIMITPEPQGVRVSVITVNLPEVDELTPAQVRWWNSNQGHETLGMGFLPDHEGMNEMPGQ